MKLCEMPGAVCSVMDLETETQTARQGECHAEYKSISSLFTANKDSLRVLIVGIASFYDVL